MYVYLHRRCHVRRRTHIKTQLLHIDRILKFQTLGIACQLNVEFFRVTRHMAFGREQATQAKTELVQARRMHVHIQFVPRLTDAAIGFDAVAIQQHIQIGTAQMLFLKNHIAIAHQLRARQSAVAQVQNAAYHGFTRQSAHHTGIQIDIALWVIFGQGRRIEAVADQGQLDFLFFVQIHRARHTNGTPIRRGDAGFADFQALLAIVTVFHHIKAACRLQTLGFELPIGLWCIKFACDSDVTIERACHGVLYHVGQSHAGQAHIQIQLLLRHIHRALRGNNAFLQSGDAGRRHHNFARMVEFELADDGFHRNAIAISRQWFAIAHIQSARQFFAACNRFYRQIQFQLGLRQGWDDGFRV